MNENQTLHAHVHSMCRHCSRAQHLGVHESLDDAKEYMTKIPEMLGGKLDNFSIRRIDDQLYIMTISTHEVVVVLAECDIDFEECRNEWRQSAIMFLLNHQINAMLNRALNDHEGHDHGDSSHDDVANRLLSQIEFPDDFAGPTH